MIGFETAVFDHEKLLFKSYEEFTADPENVTKNAGKTLAIVNVEYRKYGTKIFQLELITVSTLTIGEDGGISLGDVVVASANPEMLLPQQRPLVYKWIRSWCPDVAWNKTHRRVKRTIQ